MPRCSSKAPWCGRERALPASSGCGSRSIACASQRTCESEHRPAYPALNPKGSISKGRNVPELRVGRRPARLHGDLSRRLRRLAGPPARDDPFDSALYQALAAFEAGGEVQDLVSLVGLGPGLTPSGDDALVGTLAALDLGRAANPAAAVLRAALVAALPSPLAERTTRLSAQMLAAAAAGLYAEPILGLLERLADEDPSPHRVEDAARVLLGLGHRSGRDTLLGIAAGLGRLQPV